MKIKTKINKWDLIKLQSFYTVKETIKQSGPSEWNKIFANKATDKRVNLQNTQTSHVAQYQKNNLNE